MYATANLMISFPLIVFLIVGIYRCHLQGVNVSPIANSSNSLKTLSPLSLFVRITIPFFFQGKV